MLKIEETNIFDFNLGEICKRNLNAAHHISVVHEILNSCENLKIHYY